MSLHVLYSAEDNVQCSQLLYNAGKWDLRYCVLDYYLLIHYHTSSVLCVPIVRGWTRGGDTGIRGGGRG